MNKWKWDLAKTVMVTMVVLGVLVLSFALYALYDSANYRQATEAWKTSTEANYASLLERTGEIHKAELAAALKAKDEDGVKKLKALADYYNVRLSGQENEFASRLAKEAVSETVQADNNLLGSQLNDLQGQVADLNYLNRVLQESLKEGEDMIKKIEDWLLREENLNTVTSLRPVIFLPSDAKEAQFNGAGPAIERALKFVQVWYQIEVGVTFSLEKPVIAWGKNPASYYENLKGEAALRTIENELDSNQATIIFLAVQKSSDWAGWGGWGNGLRYPAALIGIDWYYLLCSDSSSRYNTIALVVHELGHLWGLPHSAAGNDAAIMNIGDEGGLTSGNVFPLADLSQEEKKILAASMKTR